MTASEGPYIACIMKVIMFFEYLSECNYVFIFDSHTKEIMHEFGAHCFMITLTNLTMLCLTSVCNKYAH